MSKKETIKLLAEEWFVLRDHISEWFSIETPNYERARKEVDKIARSKRVNAWVYCGLGTIRKVRK